MRAVKTLNLDISVICGPILTGVSPPDSQRSPLHFAVKKRHFSPGTCIVTDKFVSTFTEDVVKDYKYTEGDDIIAMIDCEDGTAGLTYSVVGGKLLKIVAWMEGYKITAEPKGDAMKVFINGEELERNEHIMSDNLK